jgi:late competence protein required for DNA uptake (superfamily II DNA/RNA helicase)
MYCNRCEDKIHSGKIESLLYLDVNEYYCRHCFNSAVIIERRKIVSEL